MDILSPMMAAREAVHELCTRLATFRCLICNLGAGSGSQGPCPIRFFFPSYSVFHGPVGGLNCLSYCCLFPSWYFHRHFKHLPHCDLPHSRGRLHQSKPDVLHTCQLSFGVKCCPVTSSIFSASCLALLLRCSLSLHRFLLSQKVHQLPS